MVPSCSARRTDESEVYLWRRSSDKYRDKQDGGPRDVTTSLNYLGEVNKPLFTYANDSPPGHPKTNVTMMPRPVVVHDARWLNPVPTVEREGFALVR
jgi:hypothetical protein